MEGQRKADPHASGRATGRSYMLRDGRLGGEVCGEEERRTRSMVVRWKLERAKAYVAVKWDMQDVASGVGGGMEDAELS